MKKGILSFLIILMTTATFAFGQSETTIRGMVTDSTTNNPLIGVNVYVSGTNSGATTQPDGSYEVTVPEDADILIFSYIGYQTRRIEINGRTQIDVALRSSVQNLEEMVVIGYGSQSQRQVTGSISSVESDKISNLPITRAEEALQG